MRFVGVDLFIFGAFLKQQWHTWDDSLDSPFSNARLDILFTVNHQINQKKVSVDVGLEKNGKEM